MRFHLGEHGVAGAVQNRFDARHAFAAESVAERAHNRHRAADGRLVPQLPALPLREQEQRRAVVRDDILVRGDDGLPREERGADVVDGRPGPANRFDDDLDVAGEQVVERVGPDDAVRRRIRAAGRACRAPAGRRCA